MKINERSLLRVIGLFLSLACTTFAGTVLEDFSSEPSAKGWRIFGNASLFQWDATNQNLQVTWDSAQPNSYLYQPLGTVLAKEDDFKLEFDLRLSDITTSNKPGPFEIAIGFVNFADATRAEFQRGSGVNAVHGPRSICEFAYFPEGDFPGPFHAKASVCPTIVSRDNGFAGVFEQLELTNGALFHVSLEFHAASNTLHTTLTCDGIPFGPIGDAILDSSFSDFRLDTVAIASYCDAGDDYGSVLAHGVIDNLSFTTPSPPPAQIAGQFDQGAWRVEFLSRTNWLFRLERTADFTEWTPVTAAVVGAGGAMQLRDFNPPAVSGFYRVRAYRE